MKASVSPHILMITLAGLFLGTAGLTAQDVVMQKNGQRREGQILGLADGRLKFKVGPVETSISMDQVESVTKAPPAAYQTALESWGSGNAAKTLETLKPLVDTFLGLPTPWAERSAALLGEVYLAMDQLPAAENAFAAFQKAYPGAASLSEIGLARLAVAKEDYATAKSKLEPIVTEAASVKIAGTGKSAMYGQAFYLMGLIREKEGVLPEALQDYLMAVTVFHEDQAVAAKAQERANVLIEEKKVIVP